MTAAARAGEGDPACGGGSPAGAQDGALTLIHTNKSPTQATMRSAEEHCMPEQYSFEGWVDHYRRQAELRAFVTWAKGRMVDGPGST